MKNSPPITPAWFCIKEAATYAGVCRYTINSWIDQGLKVSRSGKRYLIKRQNIDAFIEKLETQELSMDEIERKVMASLESMGVPTIKKKRRK